METNNRYFLPSEVARLVLGYLQAESFSCSYKSFLKECPHLEEYSIYLKRGQSYPLTINGFTLIQMLEEYASLKITDTQRRQHEPSVGSLWRQFDSVVQCLKVQTASKFLRVDGKTQNARMRTQRLIFKRGQNEINIKNTGQNEDASKQTVVSKESHIKSQNTTGREIKGVSGFTGTSASMLSSMLHQNIVDSTSCDSDPHVDSTSVPDFNNHALPQTFETEQISQTTNSQAFDIHQISRTLDVQTFDTPLITRVTDSSEQLSYTAPRSVDSKVYDKRYCDFKSSVFMNATTSDSIRHADSPRMPGNTEYQHANSIPPSPVIQGSQVKSPVYTNQSSSGHAQIDSPAVISNTKINSLGDSQELMPSLNTVQSSSELSTINSPAALSNNDIKKMKSSVTDISSALTTVTHENEIESSCTTCTTSAIDKLSSSKPLENHPGSLTFDSEIETKSNTNLCGDDNLIDSSTIYHDKLQENQQNPQSHCGGLEMTERVNVAVKQLIKNGLKNTSDIHKSPRRKRPPRKRAADIKADRKLHFTEHNESSNSTEDGSTVTQDDSLPTIIYEHLLKSTQLQELLAENINKQLHHDVSKNLPPSTDADASSKEKKEEVPDPVIDKNPFTPSQSLEDILDPQETQMTDSQINDIIEMTSNDPVFDSLFNLFEIDKNSFSDHSEEKDTSLHTDQNKEVEKWINSDDVQNSTYDQSFHDLHTSLSHSPQTEPCDTFQKNELVIPCTASSSTQPADVQSITQYDHAHTAYVQLLPTLPVETNTGLPHLSSIFIAPSGTSGKNSSISKDTSSETVLIQETSPEFKKVQSTVTKSPHGLTVLSLKSLSNSDEDDNDVTDFPMDVSEIATPNLSTLSAQISVTSPPYSVTSSQVLMTSAGSALVTSTMCNVSSVSSTRENKSNNSYMSFVSGMELNQNSSTPMNGGRIQANNLLDNSLAFLGLPTHASLEATAQKPDIHEDKNNSKLCTETDENEKKKISPNGKEKSPCKTRSSSTWSACLTALMHLASPDKKKNYESLMQNMGEKPSTGKSKAKRTKSTKKSRSAKKGDLSQTVSPQSCTPASSNSNCEAHTVTSTNSCASKSVGETVLSMPVNFVTPIGTSHDISGSLDTRSNSITVKSDQQNLTQNSEQISVVKSSVQVRQSSETGQRSKGSREETVILHDISDRDFLVCSEGEEEYCFSPATQDRDDNSKDKIPEKTTTENIQQSAEKSRDTIVAVTESHNTTLTNSTENSLDKSEIIYTAIPIGKAKPKDVHVRSLDFGNVDVLGLNRILSSSSKGKFASKTRPRMQPVHSPGQMTRQPSIGRGRKYTNKRDKNSDKSDNSFDNCSTNSDKCNVYLDKSNTYFNKSNTCFDKSNTDSDFIPDAAGNVFVFEKKSVKFDQSKVKSKKKKDNLVTSQISHPAEPSGAESSDHFDDDELPDPSLPPIILPKSSRIGTPVKKTQSSFKSSPVENDKQDMKIGKEFSQDLFSQNDQSCSQMSGISLLSQNTTPNKMFELSKSNSVGKNVNFIESHHKEEPVTVNRVYGQFSDISDNSMSNLTADGMKKTEKSTGLPSTQINRQQTEKIEIDLSRTPKNSADRNTEILGIRSVSNDSSKLCVENKSAGVSTGEYEKALLIRNTVGTASKNKNMTAKQSYNNNNLCTPLKNCDNTLVQITDSHGKNLTIPAGYESKVQTPSSSRSCIGQNDIVSSEDEIDIEGDWENPWENMCDKNSSHLDRTLPKGDDACCDKTISADKNDGTSDNVQLYNGNSGLEVAKVDIRNSQISSGGSGQFGSSNLKQNDCDGIDGNNQIVNSYQHLSSDSNSNSLTMNSFNKFVSSVSQLCSKSSAKAIQNTEIENNKKVSRTMLVHSSPQTSFHHQKRENIVVLSDDSNSMSSRHGNRKSRPGLSAKSGVANSTAVGELLKSPNRQFSTAIKPTRTTPDKTASNVDQNKSSFQSYRDHTEDSYSQTSIDSQQSDSTQSVSSHCSYQSAGSINMAAMMMTPPKKRITASMKSGTGLYFISRQSSKSDNTGTRMVSPKSQRTPKKRIGTPDKNKLARRSPRLKHGTNSPSQHSKLSCISRAASSPSPSSYSSVKENSSPNSKRVESRKILNVLPKESSSVVGNGGQKRQREDNSILSPQSPLKKKVKKAKKPYDMANLDIEKFLTKIYKS